MKKLGLHSMRGVLLAAGVAALMYPTIASAYDGNGDDLAEITHLNTEYSWALDNHDPEGWAGIYTKDGMFRAAQFCAVGHDQLAAIAAPRKPRPVDPNAPPAPPRPVSRHVGQIGPIVYQDKDHATAHNFVMVVQDVGRDGKGGGITTTGTYDDKYVRVNGHWLIADRLEVSPGDGPPMPCPK